MIELNKIYNEDCLEGMKRIPDGSVSLIVTDPPYLLDNKGEGYTHKMTSDTQRNSKK
nr:MAG TPA: adenine-specific methyltransferase [Caudoviricetes sp.]